jgi:hypothetical protein
VGFGSLRTIRAETPVDVPLIETDLRLENGRLKGTIRNLSNESLDKPAVVLGGTVATSRTSEPGDEATIDVLVQNNPFGQSRRTRSSARSSSATADPMPTRRRSTSATRSSIS